jgi:class 3 adenylate cyclase
VAAVETALDLQSVLAAGETTRALRVRVGVHRGSAMATTLNDHLDYFGATVREATQLPQVARGGEVILTQVLAADPRVAALLAGRGLTGDLIDASLPGLSVAPLVRLNPRTAPE